MFFTRFDPMTDQEVFEKLDAQRKPADACCKCLAGKSFSAKLEGEFAPAQLDYEFLDAENLSFTENGVRYEAPYAAATLGNVTLFSHLVPGTTRGWHGVLDWETKAITVFETWFGITVPVGGDLMGQREPDHYRDVPREIQRHYHFGWADFGNEKPEKLHTTTNRLEGRGLHWNFSTGYELLTFFPSVICSTLVELGPKMGGITVTNPSDFLKINDRYFIYTRSEVEFSGKFWIEVVDFAKLNAIGMEFGFEKDNSFTYAFHNATLEITGDIAHMENIFSEGDKEPPMARLVGRHGGRYAYRPLDYDVPMPHEEALECARKAQSIYESDSGIMASRNNLPFSSFLAGKQFKIKLDCETYAAAPWNGDQSVVYEYDVLTSEKLRWRVSGGEWQEEEYRCFEPAPDIYFFAHMCTGDPDFANLTHACDFSNGLTTTIRAQIGNWHSEWEAGSKVNFGTLEYGDIVPPFARRHHFTTDLVGKAYAWCYGSHMSSIHVYSSPESYSWTIFQDNNSGGATWSSPCYYIKLREDAYLLQWVEENCNGIQTVVVLNPRLLHDAGFSYGVNHGGLIHHVTGAVARDLGTFDIKGYF